MRADAPEVGRGNANLFKDTEHLIRLAAVMVIALVAFVVLRAAVVPRSFGQYGHYRGAAIAEAAARPIAHAGHDACEACHTDVVDQKKQGRHVVVPCEACHGPLAKHADDPASVTPPKLDTAVVCARCHEANAAKPAISPRLRRPITLAESPATPAISRISQKLKPTRTKTDTSATEAKKVMDITRRRLLVLLPAAAVAWKFVQAGTPEASPNYKLTEHWWGMLIDIPKCIGCGSCVRACAEENDVPEGYYRTWIERYHVTDWKIEKPEVDISQRRQAGLSAEPGRHGQEFLCSQTLQPL